MAKGVLKHPFAVAILLAIAGKVDHFDIEYSNALNDKTDNFAEGVH
jgi:hypothetical protein